MSGLITVDRQDEWTRINIDTSRSSCCYRLDPVCVLFSGEHYEEEFEKISMIRKVPAMRDGDFCLTER